MVVRFRDCVLPRHPSCLRAVSEDATRSTLESAVGALDWFVKFGVEGLPAWGLPILDTGDVGDGIWRAEREITRSDTRAEWWVRSV
jgi:hypothetical protein